MGHLLWGNFADMVRDEAEFREWVRTGTSRRLERYPWIRFVLRLQRISMPAYGETISDDEIEKMWHWVVDLRAGT